MQVLEKQVKQAITTRLEHDVELKAALILLDDSWGSATDAGTPRMSAGAHFVTRNAAGSVRGAKVVTGGQCSVTTSSVRLHNCVNEAKARLSLFRGPRIPNAN